LSGRLGAADSVCEVILGWTASELAWHPNWPRVRGLIDFHLDLEGHAASGEVSAALEEVRPLTVELRIIGSYPRGDSGV
jgi:hypothetical protein